MSQIFFHQQAREKIRQTIEEIASIRAPHFARPIPPPSSSLPPFANSLCTHLEQTVQDGTTYALLLLRSLLSSSLKALDSHPNPLLLKQQLDQATSALLAHLPLFTVPTPPLLQLATFAAHGNPIIGQTIANCLEQIGAQGTLQLKTSSAESTHIEIVSGLQIRARPLSPHLPTHLERPYILLTDQPIATLQDLLPLLHPLIGNGSPLLLLAPQIDPEVLASFVLNHLRGQLHIVPLALPHLEDLPQIALLTEATLVGAPPRLPLKNARFEELGRAATAEITPTHLTLTTSSSHPPTLAQIILGAPDHHPQTFRAFRQAIAVTQAAHRKGVVPGGGVALWRAAQSLPPSPAASILQTATEAPIRNLIHASGLDPSPRLAELLTLPPTHGFNLLTEQIEDLTLAPILDPLLILETVLTQAVHQTGQILLTDLLIFSEK